MKCLPAVLVAVLAGCGGPAGDAQNVRVAHRPADSVCTGGPVLTISSAARDNPAMSLTGLYVTVQANGITLAAGWTPFSAADLCAGQEYTITAADYRRYRFAGWEDGVASWARAITVQGSAAFTALYQVGGSIAPLYSWPTDANGALSSTWMAMADAHRRWPTVALIPVVNNQNGPGPAPDPSWSRGIDALAAAGCKVAGYVYTDYGRRPLDEVQTDIANWKAWYPQVSAAFIDQMSNSAGQEGYYAALTSFARSRGFDFVVGNPGAPTIPSYIGTVDTMVIREGTDVATSFASWQSQYSPNNFATLTYGLSSPLPSGQVSSNMAAVAYQYVTDDGVFPDANPWDGSSMHLDALLSLLSG